MSRFTRIFTDLVSPKTDVLPKVGGRVFVLGSAPKSVRPAAGVDWTYATVNGSQAVLKTWGLEPDITLFGRTWKNGSPANAETRRAVRGLATKQLLCIGWAHDVYRYRPMLRELDYRYDSLMMITPGRRVAMLGEIIGYDSKQFGKLSNGLILSLMCLHQGAAEVVMSGFSLTSDGHAYSDKGLKRQHVGTDAIALGEIGRRGLPIVTNDPAFAAESGLRLADDAG